MSFLYNLEGSLLAPDRSYQPRYINVIANVSRIRISNSPSANAETPPFAAAVARNAGRSARKNMSFRMAVHPEPSSFPPFFSSFPRAHHTSLEYSYTFHRFFFFSFFRREIDLFPREISSRRIKQKNEITIRTLIVRGSLYYFGQNFGVITGNLISNFQSLRCILVFSFDGQATTEGYFLGTGTVG